MLSLFRYIESSSFASTKSLFFADLISKNLLKIDIEFKQRKKHVFLIERQKRVLKILGLRT